MIGRTTLLGLALVITACSARTAPADTTVATSSTTTITETTTTTVATTTSTEPECVERDGVLYDNRGFVCPPIMATSIYEVGNVNNKYVSYRPGTYSLRLFPMGFTFTRADGFKSGGENQGAVAIDENPFCDAAACVQEMVVISAPLVEAFRSILNGEYEGVANLASSPVEYWGAGGTQFDFNTTECLACSINLEDLYSPASWTAGMSVRVLFIDVPGGPIGVIVAAHQSRFDQYWTEVAEPILASFEFTAG